MLTLFNKTFVKESMLPIYHHTVESTSRNLVSCRDDGGGGGGEIREKPVTKTTLRKLYKKL